jgi:tetratricopeptide (TPR) repeat protein
MQYQTPAGLRPPRPVIPLTLAFGHLVLMFWTTAPRPVLAAQPSPAVDVSAVLKQSKAYRLRFREGEAEAATANVALLESATAARTDNADLWNAMGLAYVYLATRATLPGGNRGDAVIALQKGMPAFNRALQIDPDQAEALSVRAGMRALIGLQINSPDLVPQALADMNRAVQLAPDSVAVRLIRAFGAPVMPDGLRNRRHEAADLDFLIEKAEGNRAGDFITILRADLHFENGELDNARQLYEGIAGTGAASAMRVAKSRLSLLAQGRDAMMKEISELRAVAGTRCSMCHGREDAAPSPP